MISAAVGAASGPGTSVQHDAIICDLLSGHIYKNRFAAVAAAIDSAIAAARDDRSSLSNSSQAAAAEAS